MTYVKQLGRVLHIGLAAPSANALGQEMLDSLEASVSRVEMDDSVNVVRFFSRQHNFCVGADLKEMRDWYRQTGGIDEVIAHVERMQLLFARIEALPKVTIAEISGAAVGGGLELCLACDLRVVDPRATVGLPETRLGLLPGAGGTQRLTRLCGPGIARRLILTGELVTGFDAVGLGIATWCWDGEQRGAEMADLLRRIGELSPEALAACKRCLADAAIMADTGFQREINETRDLLGCVSTQARIDRFLDGRGVVCT